MNKLILIIAIVFSGMLGQAQNDIIIPKKEGSAVIYNCTVTKINGYEVTYSINGESDLIAAREVIKYGDPAIKLPYVPLSEDEILPIEALANEFLGEHRKKGSLVAKTAYGTLTVKLYTKKKTVIGVMVTVTNNSIIQQQIEDAHDYQYVKRGSNWSDYWYGEKTL